MTDPIRIYALTELVTCSTIVGGRPHAVDDHPHNAMGQPVKECANPQPYYKPLSITTVCGTCGGSGSDFTNANECSTECNGSHADITGRTVCPRGPEQCEACNGCGRVPVALREVIHETIRKWDADGGDFGDLADALIASLVAQGEKE